MIGQFSDIGIGKRVKTHLIFLGQAFDCKPRNGEKLLLNHGLRIWRRGRDLNPRHPMGELDFESSAFSRARPPLRFYLLPLILPHNAKKIPKNCRTLLGKYSTVYGYAVIQSTIVAKLIQRFHCSRLGIKTAKNEPAYSRL
jgi:hypothetical protein